ncbi:hypothetical protein ACDY96_10935 [Rhizobium mongolense]
MASTTAGSAGFACPPVGKTLLPATFSTGEAIDVDDAAWELADVRPIW